jgi:hypothetical protein
MLSWVIKHPGDMDELRADHILFVFLGLIPWTLHFCVLVAWTERLNSDYLTLRAAPKFSRSIHAP